jgi:hypothetical protein
VCTSPLAVTLFMSLVVHMLSALCHRHSCAADLLPAHTNTGSRSCPSWPNLCTRTHAHARSFAGVCPQPTPPGRSSSFSLSLFPCLVHAIIFVSPPWPCRRRSAHTQTLATEGRAPASPICDRARRSAVPSPRTPTHRRTCVSRALDPKFEPIWPLRP